jgi:hypothetical protein
MAEQIVKAKSFSELQNILLGEVTKDELQELGLGVITPTRVSSAATLTPLYPPKARKSLMDYVQSRKKGMLSEGYIYIPKIIRVVSPHVPLGSPGVATMYLADSGDVALSPLPNQKVEIPLGSGPMLMAFYPNFSMPLGDEGAAGSNGGRTFVVLSQHSGLNLQVGNSAFSTFDLWMPEYSLRTQYYDVRPAEVHKIEISKVKAAFTALVGRAQYANAAIDNSNAALKTDTHKETGNVRLTSLSAPIRLKDGTVRSQVRRNPAIGVPSAPVVDPVVEFPDDDDTSSTTSVYDVDTSSVVGREHATDGSLPVSGRRSRHSV